MKRYSLLALTFLLFACQPKTEAESEQPASLKATPTKTEAKSESNKNFSMLQELPYTIIESDEECDGPVVTEFFAYQCPHCYKLETYAEKWKKQHTGKVEFQAVPTHLGHKEFGSFLIVHQAAKMLGILDKAIPTLFNRLHVEKKAFSSPEEAIALLVSLGATENAAKAAVENEEAIKTGIDENFKLLSKYKITGVPTVIVNHKYQFNVTTAGGYDKVFDVVDETLKLPSRCSAK